MRASVFAMCLICVQVTAEEMRRDVPEELFGIPLGAVVRFDPEDKHRLIGLDGIHITGREVFGIPGWHVYFRPSRDYPGFPYIKLRSLGNDLGDVTTFRLHLLPLLPESAKHFASPGDAVNLAASVDYEIMLVEWQGFEREQPRAPHDWANDFCEIFTLDFAVDPNVLNIDEEFRRSYRCEFTQGHYEFAVTGETVGNMRRSRVSLEFEPEIQSEKYDLFHERRSRFLLESIRPY